MKINSDRDEIHHFLMKHNVAQYQLVFNDKTISGWDNCKINDIHIFAKRVIIKKGVEEIKK